MTVQEYFKRFEQKKLEEMLQQFCDGIGDIHPDVALMICDELHRRQPSLPDPYKAFYALCASYLP